MWWGKKTNEKTQWNTLEEEERVVNRDSKRGAEQQQSGSKIAGGGISAITWILPGKWMKLEWRIVDHSDVGQYRVRVEGFGWRVK